MTEEASRGQESHPEDEELDEGVPRATELRELGLTTAGTRYLRVSIGLFTLAILLSYVAVFSPSLIILAILALGVGLGGSLFAASLVRRGAGAYGGAHEQAAQTGLLLLSVGAALTILGSLAVVLWLPNLAGSQATVGRFSFARILPGLIVISALNIGSVACWSVGLAQLLHHLVAPRRLGTLHLGVVISLVIVLLGEIAFIASFAAAIPQLDAAAARGGNPLTLLFQQFAVEQFFFVLQVAPLMLFFRAAGSAVEEAKSEEAEFAVGHESAAEGTNMAQ